MDPKELEELLDAFKRIEEQSPPLIPSTVICTVCGCVIGPSDPLIKYEICSHLRSLCFDSKK